ncbi:MAG: diguanylate cyclase [Ktedonobacteraceae bacterium]|nr:diguanylate cyclase [Ktedonobacteraceae bacterium]
MRFSRNKSFLSNQIASPAAFSKKRTIPTPGNVLATRRTFHHSNPLLNISIGRRLALGFLIPALIAILTLNSVSMQSQQRLSQEATFYQHLLATYTSLTTASDDLENMHTHLLQTVAYAAQPHALSIVLGDYQKNIRASASHYNAALSTYLQQDLIELDPSLVSLFTEAGHADQIEEQQIYSKGVQMAWKAYIMKQEHVLILITKNGNTDIKIFAVAQANEAFTDVERELRTLITFSGSLAPSLSDASSVEVRKLVIITILAALGILFGIGIVGWLISSTLVQRLWQLRSVVQAIANGQVDARLKVEGRDEIADVSNATNSMVDTLVGLLEETRRQHDELAKGEELKQLHEALQHEHEALNEANGRLATLATIDPLTGLPNHRTVITRVEEELSFCQRAQKSCAFLFLDIDHFKRINDTWGHRAGDEILREVGRRLVDTLRQEDFVGRYGGEEFAIVLANTALEEAQQTAERLCGVLAKEPCLWEAGDAQATVSIQITGSFGVAVYQLHGTTRETLIEAADSAMYQAKHSGRNCVCVAGHELTEIGDQQETNPVRQTQEIQVIQALLAVANAHDLETSAHAVRMMQMVEGTAHQLGCSEEEIYVIRVAALLHDIGKIGVPDHILHKPGPLTDEEWAVMRNHPKIGRQILAQVGEKFEIVSHIVVAHHERWDGQGYPYGLSEEMIPLGARILTVADSYDAMTSNRPYRAALPISEALIELRRCSGYQFDPRVVEAFIQVLEKQENKTKLLSLQSI